MAKASSARVEEELPDMLLFDRPGVLRLVRTAPRLGRVVTADNVSEFRKRGTHGAGRLLAATAIFEIARRQEPEKGGKATTPRGLPAYFAFQDAGNGKPEKGRNQFGHDEFTGLLAIVRAFDETLDSKLSVREGRAAFIRELFARTDAPGTDGEPHPVLEMIPPPSDYKEHDPRRDAAMQGDRLIRFILEQAMEDEVGDNAS